MHRCVCGNLIYDNEMNCEACKNYLQNEKDRVRNMRYKAKDNSEEIVRINADARKENMSYGEYVGREYAKAVTHIERKW